MTTTKTIRESLSLLDASERRLLASVINRFSVDGGHPFAEEHTLPFFTAAFARACLLRARANAKEPAAVEALLAKLAA